MILEIKASYTDNILREKDVRYSCTTHHSLILSDRQRYWTKKLLILVEVSYSAVVRKSSILKLLKLAQN